MNDAHVLPVDGWGLHVSSAACWCFPDLQAQDNGSVLVVHRAASRQEVAVMLESSLRFTSSRLSLESASRFARHLRLD